LYLAPPPCLFNQNKTLLIFPAVQNGHTRPNSTARPRLGTPAKTSKLLWTPPTAVITLVMHKQLCIVHPSKDFQFDDSCTAAVGHTTTPTGNVQILLLLPLLLLPSLLTHPHLKSGQSSLEHRRSFARSRAPLTVCNIHLVQLLRSSSAAHSNEHSRTQHVL
jgi:hypothetical protein